MSIQTSRQVQPGKRRRVLVVDDNCDSAEAMAELIAELGHEARTALDGPSSVHVAEEWQPDIIFLDIGLPGMDGYEVARVLREHNSPATLVALTGYSQESDRRKSREAGFRQHLVKPLGIEAIERILNAG